MGHSRGLGGSDGRGAEGAKGGICQPEKSHLSSKHNRGPRGVGPHGARQKEKSGVGDQFRYPAAAVRVRGAASAVDGFRRDFDSGSSGSSLDSEAPRNCDQCSSSQRARRALADSSTHSSTRTAISLRRFAAWLSLVSSKLSSERTEALRRYSHGKLSWWGVIRASSEQESRGHRIMLYIYLTVNIINVYARGRQVDSPDQRPEKRCCQSQQRRG